MRTMVPTARLHQEALQFRLILAATYPCFLAAAAVARFKPARDGSRSGLAPARRSIFGEARAMAVQAIPFAFMG
jgi:gamma-glutamyl:cysteine ligase YbdK (ATP-grasp superfamily)